MNRNIALTEWEVAGARIVNENIFILAQNGRVHELQNLFRGGIDPDSIDKHGNTILIIACQNNHIDLVKLCLQYSANINWRNNSGKSALDFALMFRYQKLVNYLFKKGALIEDMQSC